MPAIRIERLKAQVAEVGSSFTQPQKFTRDLHELLEAYTDRTIRTPVSSKPVILLPHYQIPPQVMRELEARLIRQAHHNPEAAIDLADRLWADGFYETRLLAIHLLGEICAKQPETVKTRLLAWAQPEEEPHLLELLLTSGKTRLREIRPDLWLELVKHWLDQHQKAYQSMGLRALQSMIENPEFENLPAAFAVLEPLFQAAPAALHPELVRVTVALARRSPVETVYMIRHALSISSAESLPRLVRRCLPVFDASTQERLRRSLRQERY